MKDFNVILLVYILFILLGCNSKQEQGKEERKKTFLQKLERDVDVSVIYGNHHECKHCLDLDVTAGDIFIPDSVQRKLIYINPYFVKDFNFQVNIVGHRIFEDQLTSKELKFLFNHKFKVYGALIDVEDNVKPIFRADSVFVMKDGDFIAFEKLFKPSPYITIHNKNDYDTSFLNDLSTINFDSVTLIGNEMIVQRNNWKNTIDFPDIPPLGQYKVFTARKDNLAVALSIERINYTTIDYKVEMVKFGKANYTSNGKAHLNSRFFLGGESARNTNTGHMLYLTEFSSNDEGEGCYTTISIGYQAENPDILYAVLDKNCNDSLPSISNDSFKTLIEK